jgi:uncharacterized protein
MSHAWAEQLMNDHQTTEKVFDAVAHALNAPAGQAPGLLQDALLYFEGYVDGCHNLKEEQHLFPLAEARGISRQGGPLAVMLGEHDESRLVLPRLAALIHRFVGGDRSVLDDLRSAFRAYSTLLKDHFWKENDILYPMARRVMTDTDGELVMKGIEATEAAVGPDTRAKFYALAARIINSGGVEDLSLGVERDVMAAILNTLPVELSFVDKDDRVKYFSHENGEKIFPRNRGAIGTAVQNCHPEKSVHIVNRILEDFKAGTRTVAEFWMEMGPKFVHIRYFAVRNPAGEYLGTLEVVQDVAPIRALTGQRRILAEA